MDRSLDPRLRRRRRTRRAAAAAAVLAALVIVPMLVSGWMRPSVARHSLRTGRVDRGPVEATLLASGTIVPDDEHVLVSPLDTRLVHVLETPGAAVHVGRVSRSSGSTSRDPRFVAVLDLVARVAATDASVLVLGESGTGKEIVAEALHRNSRRRDAPFVKVNLGGIPASLFESEMFGHVKGAFTDARADRAGRFAVANGGSILLDEIGDLDPSCQVKLLRVLQNRTYEALGSSQTRGLDVRVVSATNRDLQACVQAGTFREDLFYRLNLITVRLPSLAERRSDIPLLATHFLSEVARTHGRGEVVFAEPVARWLAALEWPGNVRQLRHLIERTVLITESSVIDVADFQRMLQMDRSGIEGERLPSVGSMTLEEMEKAMIVKALGHHGGNLSRVAESLGMSRAALYRRLERYGIRT